MKTKFAYILCGLALASCSNSEEVDVAQGPVIEFSQPFTGKQSRAVGEISNTNLKESQFKVWGWKEDGEQVFDGRVVSYENGAWTYAGKEMWDTEQAYDFVAVAPTDNIGDDVSASQSYISISHIPQWQKSDEAVDYLVSDPIDGITYLDAADGLQFTFRHILGKLQVWARCTFDDEAFSNQIKTVEATNLSLACKGYTEYSYEVAYGAQVAKDYDNSGWRITNIASTSKTFGLDDAVEIDRNEYQQLLPSILVAPTPAGETLDVKLSLKYNIVMGNGESFQFEITETALPALSAFHQGYVTNLFLNIRISSSSLGLISATVDKVVDYETANTNIDHQGNPNF